MKEKGNKYKKYYTAIFVFIMLSVCNIFISVILHKILSKSENWMQFEPFASSLKMVLTNKGARTIFLGVETFVILGIIASLMTRVTAYKSNLVKITEDIYIPQAMGENQYGSARFYNKDELDKVFTVAKISKTDPQIIKLMRHGYDDLNFMKGDEKNEYEGSDTDSIG